MARSLDALIEFLLEEIALGSESGLSLPQIALLVRQFYALPLKHAENASHEYHGTLSPAGAENDIDRPFLSKVWKWLSRHPDISIGKDHKYNNMTLTEAESHHPDILKPLSMNNELSRGVGDELSPDASTVAHNVQPRFYVSEQRMWIAVCGHPPDPVRVYPSEWVLMQYIAASRKDGLLQGDLVRLSGQDKRSVPKRTDALHRKGYIVKKVIYIKGNKTSRLYLRRFADIQHASSNIGGLNADQLTVRHIARQLFHVLKNTPLIPQEDLGDALGMTTPGRKQILTQLIRTFGKLGCVKRIKTAFGPSARVQDLKISIQFLKEPTDVEWQTRDMQGVDLDRLVEVLASFYEADAGHSDGVEAEDENVLDDNEPLDTAITGGNATTNTRQFLPQWNPDRVLANVLFQVVQEAGMIGMSNTRARNFITGPFIKRTLESLLVKISNRSLQAQPASLKHLAILRTFEFFKGILQFLHFTVNVYLEKVEDSTATWQDVSGGKEFLKQLEKTKQEPKSVLGVVPVDNFGFALRSKPESQTYHGKASMSQLMQDAKIKDLPVKTGEPFLRQSSSGRLEIGFHPSQGRSLTHTVSRTTQTDQTAPPDLVSNTNLSKVRKSKHPKTPKTHTQNSKQDRTESKARLGRPRTFTRGTEVYWKEVCAFLLSVLDPTISYEGHRKSRLTSTPSTFEIFRQRPTNFDQTIIQAMERGLPLASDPHSISENWIESITNIMQRSQCGLYITPVGFHLGSRGKKAQVMILRSSRLKELDLSDHWRVWPWQHLVSNASHSFRYQRYYPCHSMTPDHLTASSKSGGDSAHNRSDADSTSMGPLQSTLHDRPQPPSSQPQALLSSASLSAVEVIKGFEVREPTNFLDTGSIIPNATGALTRSQSTPIQNTGIVEETQLLQIPNGQDLGSEPKAKKLRTAAPPRSLRKRKLTIKAVENLEASSIEHDGVTGVQSQATRRAVDEIAREITVVESAGEPSDSLQQAGTMGLVQKGYPADSNPTQERLQTIAQANIVLSQNCKDTVQAPVVLELPQNHCVPAGDVALNSPNSKERKSSKKPSSATNNTSEKSTSGNDVIPRDIDTSLNDEALLTAPMRVLTTNQSLPDTDVLAPGTPMSVVPNLPQSTKAQNANFIPPTPSSNRRKRARTIDNEQEPVSEIGQEEYGSPSRKRVKTDTSSDTTRAQVRKLCRILVLELVGLCSGLAPNVPWTFRRAMVPKWQEAGVASHQLNAKNVRGAIRSLCDSGKLKQLTFAFRGKSGAMVKMSVVALRGMDATNPAVIDLQMKMQEMEPADYVPPELEAECQRVPDESNTRYSKEIYGQRNHDMGSEKMATPKPDGQRRRSRKSRQSRSESYAADPAIAIGLQQNFQLESPLPASPAAQLAVSLNTGFLTLSVPRIQELHLPSEYQLTYKEWPVGPQAGIDTVLAEPTISIRKRKYVRRGGLQRTRTARFDPETHKLIWKPSLKSKPPLCIDDIPNMKTSRGEAQSKHGEDGIFMRFEAELNCIIAWEETMLDKLDEIQATPTGFINHTYEDQSGEIFEQPPLVFKALILFADGEEKETDFPETESWPPFVAALQTSSPPSGSPTTKATRRQIKKSTKRRREAETISSEEDASYAREPIKRRKRINAIERPRRSLHTVLAVDEVDPSTYPSMKRSRAGQLLRYMSEEEKYQVVVAVVTVRTLTGGIEKFIDWQTICRLLPAQEESVLKDSWKTISNRYRKDIAELSEGFQYGYLEALTNDEVASVNFDAIHTTDWESIFKWALANMDKTIVKKVEDLPANRAQLLRRNDYVFTETRGLREILGYNVASTIPRKEEILSSIVYGKPLNSSMACTHPIPLGTKLPAEEEESDLRLSRAKSWVIATLLTPDTTEAMKIQEKLLTLDPSPQECETLLEKAIRSLQRDKLLSRSQIIKNLGKSSTQQRHDHQFTHLRKYEASAKFFELLDFRRMVTTTMLKCAANYKLKVMDPAFQHGMSVTLSKDTVLEDGEMVAILNLFASGMLRIRPGPDVPASRWGLEWQKHGYTTRMIDKKSLGFSINLVPVKYSYVYGDPLVNTRSGLAAMIPRGDLDQADGMGKIPLWFDIMHDFQPGMWEMVLGAVLGLVSTRPGISVRELVRTFGYAASVREVEMVLEWAERLHLLKPTSSGAGWESCPWWWMGVGVGGGWRLDSDLNIAEVTATS